MSLRIRWLFFFALFASTCLIFYLSCCRQNPQRLDYWLAKSRDTFRDGIKVVHTSIQKNIDDMDPAKKKEAATQTDILFINVTAGGVIFYTSNYPDDILTLGMALVSTDSDDVDLVHESVVSTAQALSGNLRVIVFTFTNHSRKAWFKLEREICGVASYINIVNCELRYYSLERMPGHVRELRNKLYKPLCVRQLLNTYAALLWSDGHQYVLSNLSDVRSLSHKYGVAGWLAAERPTSAFTHPATFSAMSTTAEQFLFQHLLSTRFLFINNFESLYNRVILPWIRCSLSEECALPIGSKSSGCNPEVRPLYHYTGCHLGEESVFNVALGSFLGQHNSSYILPGESSFVTESEMRVRNATTTPTPATTPDRFED